MQKVAVFDTNVLLSGIGWRGSPYRCLELARTGVVSGLTCEEILKELGTKLMMKLGMPDGEVTDVITDLLSFLDMVAIPNVLRLISNDPADNKVVECGVVGNATHIVTGDRRHLLPIGSFEGIAIVAPARFLAEISKDKAI